MRIHETLGEDLWGFTRLLREDLQDFGRGFVRLWEKICEDSQDFGRGFMRLWEKILEDSQDFGRGFVRLWERIRETLGEDS